MASKRKDKCITAYCRGLRSLCHRKCPKCRSQIMRKKNPFHRRWRTMKDRAKRRGTDFNLPFPVFESLARAAGFDGSKFIHVDRKEATMGYSETNIQFITGSENSIKSQVERRTPEHKQHMIERKLRLSITRQVVIPTEPDTTASDLQTPAASVINECAASDTPEAAASEIEDEDRPF